MAVRDLRFTSSDRGQQTPLVASWKNSGEKLGRLQDRKEELFVGNVVPNVCLGRVAEKQLPQHSPPRLLPRGKASWRLCQRFGGISDETLSSVFSCIQLGNFLVLACSFFNDNYNTSSNFHGN